jgi:hypothetical protein
MVEGLRPSLRAMARTPSPACTRSAISMRSSSLRWRRVPACLSRSGPMRPAYQSTSGPSLRPVERVSPLRHTLPVRLETPTACAACVKFMPAFSSSA